MKYEIKFKDHCELFSCQADIQSYRCPQCDFATEFRVILKYHIEVVHQKLQIECDMNDIFKDFTCEKCSFQSCSLLVLGEHMWNCRTIKRQPPDSTVGKFKCKRCSYRTKHRGNFRIHAMTRHCSRFKWFECDQCAYVTTSKFSLQVHMKGRHRLNGDVKTFKCEECTFATYWKISLKRHKALKHADFEKVKWFECEHCPFRTKYKCTLRRHTRLRHDV